MYTRRSGDLVPAFNPPATSLQPDAVDVKPIFYSARTGEPPWLLRNAVFRAK
jgi:hypothetical protein